MTEFGVAATLDVDVDRRSLADARSEIEDELGDVSVGVSGTGGVRADGGDIGIGALTEQAEEQTDILEDILEELENGVGGGGGGGGLLGGGGGLGNAAATGGTAGLLSRIGLSGGVGAAAKFGGGGLLGLGLGLGGVRGLQETGVTEQVRDTGDSARGLPGGEIAGGLAQFIPGVGLGAKTLDIAGGGDGNAVDDLRQNRESAFMSFLNTVSDGGGPPTGPTSQSGKFTTSQQQLTDGDDPQIDTSIINRDAIGEGGKRSFQEKLADRGLTTTDNGTPAGNPASPGETLSAGFGVADSAVGAARSLLPGGESSPESGSQPSQPINVSPDVTVNVDQRDQQNIQNEIDRAIERAKSQILDEVRQSFDSFGF